MDDILALTLAPIFADNRPPGILGWLLATAIVMTALNHWLAKSSYHQ
ncbi:hypothetical protein LFAB_16935 [Lactiplantibacillus fabifermentans T30PCM01]|uniref:Uncharacterized protein n=1 Tax=Lactiplantibacillus fabifermentans T30PCM01 TaxID=1400520 RepID=W6T4I0_9LACO|nr:hypothetical protein LFAB_16935 [Lactiplantibacillus fabifermentans T30PCM01]